MANISKVSSNVNIALDIDDVLATQETVDIAQAAFFLHQGVILTAIRTHYVFPGVIEFIKFLFSEKVRVSFYSSGLPERNSIFVECLLRRALGDREYEGVKNDVPVLSTSNESVIATQNQKFVHERLYGFFPGNVQKDLSRVLRKNDELDNAVLVDNDYSFSACNQVSNLLFVPGSNERTFNHLVCTIKYGDFELDGQKSIELTLTIDNDYDLIDWRVINNQAIFLIRQIGKYELRFLDIQTNKIRSEIISSHNNRSLFTKLENNFEGKINNEELRLELYQFIESISGKTKTICHSANRIYYVAGLIWTALNELRVNHTPMAQTLFSLQFKQIDDHRYHMDYASLRNDRFYWLGLEKLRKFKPGLQFTHPRSYRAHIQQPIPAEEIPLLQQFIDNGASDCCIM